MVLYIIESAEDFNAIMKNIKTLVVIQFTASWCGPCKAISPKFNELSEYYRNINCYKLDVNDVAEVADYLKISSLPTFQFYKNGKKVDELKGADEKLLEDYIIRNKFI